MKKVQELYSAADIRGLERKKLIWSILAAATGGAAVLLCVLFAASAGTLNAAELELRAIVTSGVVGCAVIYVYINVIKALKSELTHAKMLSSGERERVCGHLDVCERIKIPGSIEIRRVTVGDRRLSVISGRAAALPEGEAAVYAVNNYIAAWEAEERAPYHADGPRIWRFIKNVFSQLHVYVPVILLSAILWSWIFTIVTDVPADKKLTVFVDAPYVEDRLLAAELEKTLPEGIEKVKVHPFSYAVFDGSEINAADIYIVSETDMENYAAAFAETALEGEYWYRDGVPVGVRLGGAAGEFISYGEGDYYLCLGAAGAHLEDGTALETARRILELH